MINRERYCPSVFLYLETLYIGFPIRFEFIPYKIMHLWLRNIYPW